jgi:hypothetical protein
MQILLRFQKYTLTSVTNCTTNCYFLHFFMQKYRSYSYPIGSYLLGPTLIQLQFKLQDRPTLMTTGKQKCLTWLRTSIVQYRNIYFVYNFKYQSWAPPLQVAVFRYSLLSE